MLLAFFTQIGTQRSSQFITRSLFRSLTRPHKQFSFPHPPRRLFTASSKLAMSSPFAALIQQEILTVPSFELECGRVLRDVPVAYKTWGKLNETKDNVMVICHAFTGSADVEDWCVQLSLFSICRLTYILPSEGGVLSWVEGRRSTRDDTS